MIRTVALASTLIVLAGCVQAVDMADLRSEIGSDPVIMLSTSTCGYCKKMRADLDSWNVEFLDIDVERNRNGQRAYEMLEGRGVPILLVGEKTVHGYDPERARALLGAADLIPENSNPQSPHTAR
ncbi:glutaredoxin family protein [Dokdonella sp.]|uniref:glutaredoxin family protein n=1 Tax=Dokdonella sp. TaxID=2291710 RepID=UPI003C5BEA0B